MHVKSYIQVADNFTYGELYGHRPDNRPETVEQFLNLLYGTHKILQPIRRVFGAVHVSSGRRCKNYNRSVGGTLTSDHLTGNAFDIICTEANITTVYRWAIDNLKYDKIIFERRGKTHWLHISFKRLGNNRQLSLVSLSAGNYAPYNGQNLEAR